MSEIASLYVATVRLSPVATALLAACCLTLLLSLAVFCVRQATAPMVVATVAFLPALGVDIGEEAHEAYQRGLLAQACADRPAPATAEICSRAVPLLAKGSPAPSEASAPLQTARID
ncbi:hypothetical protein CKO28_13780 [Rhodovibrio sodomensis]|uniref:Uncharacterized protein n=1 Tax=Rhodovibrio sodomensis TaxID=1088 RepID=A0ABS1DFU3_9PROT|nr:hypothetical protein [Rhodovibrio sodomensis]MBK1669104.1 hypothetical protein [Rhodovibrio sodomensis]